MHLDSETILILTLHESLVVARGSLFVVQCCVSRNIDESTSYGWRGVGLHLGSSVVVYNFYRLRESSFNMSREGGGGE